METPAFRFSDESSDIVDKPATSRVEMEDRIEKLAKVYVFMLLTRFGSCS
jgi:hypothetical protein